ncbi:hypothetical protein [Desertivirga brevis]|nr:hypothetical protein [Pedobacter sp. SYSU D00873]
MNELIMALIKRRAIKSKRKRNKWVRARARSVYAGSFSTLQQPVA